MNNNTTKTIAKKLHRKVTLQTFCTDTYHKISSESPKKLLSSNKEFNIEFKAQFIINLLNTDL